jgi:prepilin-type processing-associated H-X9-DG protein
MSTCKACRTRCCARYAQPQEVGVYPLELPDVLGAGFQGPKPRVVNQLRHPEKISQKCDVRALKNPSSISFNANMDPTANTPAHTEWPSNRHSRRTDLLFTDGHVEAPIRNDVIDPRKAPLVPAGALWQYLDTGAAPPGSAASSARSGCTRGWRRSSRPSARSAADRGERRFRAGHPGGVDGPRRLHPRPRRITSAPTSST